MSKTIQIMIDKRETVTNGDVIKAVFPSAEVKEEIVKDTISNRDIFVGCEVFLYIHKPCKKGDFGFGIRIHFDKDWWNAPYKTESEDKE